MTEELKDLKVKPGTYKELIKLQGNMMLQYERKFSMDDIIMGLIRSQPKVSIKADIDKTR